MALELVGVSVSELASLTVGLTVSMLVVRMAAWLDLRLECVLGGPTWRAEELVTCQNHLKLRIHLISREQIQRLHDQIEMLPHST